MTTQTLTPPSGFHRRHAEGKSFWGPGDIYTFLVTGEESDGAYFSMLAIVPPQGGPVPAQVAVDAPIVAAVRSGLIVRTSPSSSRHGISSPATISMPWATNDLATPGQSSRKASPSTFKRSIAKAAPAAFSMTIAL